MTEKCYYKDTETTEFEANIIRVIPLHQQSPSKNQRWQVVLDRTYFYPEGGGQPADKGWLNGIPVLDVQKDGDTVYHFLAADPGEDKIKGKIKGKIDTKWRHDFMQQHTGQHIISGALWKVGKYKTESVHMGTDYTTIEIDAADIPESALIEVETLANRVINENLPIRFQWTDQKGLQDFPLRKPTALTQNLRLVIIGDFDCVACGGVHFDSTRHVELVKATAVENIRDHARITWKIGKRAFEDYRQKDTIISGLKPILATSEDQFIEKAIYLNEEIIALKRKANGIETRLAETIADGLFEHREKRVNGDHGGDESTEANADIITGVWKNESEFLLKKVVKNLLKRKKCIICLVNIVEDKVRWSIGCTEDTSVSFTGIKDELLPLIGGKGGGRFPLWQGTGSNPDGVDAFIEGFRKMQPPLIMLS